MKKGNSKYETQKKIKKWFSINFSYAKCKFFSTTANAAIKPLNESDSSEVLSSKKYNEKNRSKSSGYSSNKERLAFEKFYEETSKLIRESMDEKFFSTIDLNLDDGSVVIDNNQETYSLEKLKTCAENNKKYMRSINKENEDNLVLPISEILDVIGAKVTRKDEKITINDSGNNVELSINRSNMKINNSKYNLASEVTEKYGQVMASKDVLTKALGIDVNYDEENNVISLKRPFQTMRLIVKLNDENVDLEKYKAVKTIISPDNTAILQFNSIIDTQLCYEDLKNNQGVKYVEPDMYINNNISRIEEDSSTNNSNERAYSYRSWGAKHIESDKYVEYIDNKGIKNSATVAVIDTGVDIDHPFLKDKLLPGRDFVFVYSENDEKDGHGTHVAGIVADNTTGLDVKILPIKVLDIDSKFDAEGTSLLVFL